MRARSLLTSSLASAILASAILVGGCHKKPTEGGVRLAQVSEAFGAAGLHTDQFQPTDPARFNAQKCVAGTLEGVETVVCEYGSPDALALGKKAGEQWAASATTAAVLGNGRTLLAVADRAHSDPNGKTIHKITQAFSKTR
ncbi:MAG: hypothetical protein JWN44_4955 [Myxococcales bacterium]|nr:hypothetical protein [Myxococcales bacterium]